MSKFALKIVLVEPKIPSNTGNIIRLCANTGANLYLVGPLGFDLDDSKMRRAGLDYHDLCSYRFYNSWNEFWQKEGAIQELSYSITTRAKQTIYEKEVPINSWFFFGSETRGLSETQRTYFKPDNQLKIPMCKKSRSLNLSNAVAVCVYEVWRRYR